MTREFKNQAILVTGSTRGIGRAIATLLLNSGATVGIHGQDPIRVNEACAGMPHPEMTIPLAADFSSPAEASRVVRDFVSRAGKIDGLVNNAGRGKALAFRGVTLDKWRATFSCNLEAAVEASREAYISMRSRESGTIVNMASLAAHGPGKWMGADYAASKAGLVSLTKSLAFEAARLGIRVNAVSPGMIETDMTSMLADRTKDSLAIPIGRMGRPEEIASVAAFLLSERSSYVTGQVLHVNGGLYM